MTKTLKPQPFVPTLTPVPGSAVEVRVPTIEHAGLLEDCLEMPRYLLPDHAAGVPQQGILSCSYCGVGDGGRLERVPEKSGDGQLASNLRVYREVLSQVEPTTGCIKLRSSMMRQKTAYPIHTSPSVLDRQTGRRRPISYAAAIARLAELLLLHRMPRGRTLLYASGQVDYFTVFALQEVLRLLGVRNLTGNAEHCLNAGAVHNEMLTGQEGPFVTINQAIHGPNRFYLLNGWNGYVSHPPVFKAILARKDADAYLIEVMVTESAKAVAESLGRERVLLIRPRTDPHLALSVAHELFTRHPQAISTRFVERFGDRTTFQQYAELARAESYAPERVAERIAAEPEYAPRLLEGIRRIALKLAQPDVVPVNIPSMGLSQTSGAVAHCLWGSALGSVGKYGLDKVGSLAGGTLRLAGQINAESEVQGLSRKYFMGRIPMSQAVDAARRMGLPDDAYEAAAADPGRAALDYSEPTAGTPELFLCVGTQFEANMMGRKRWIEKLTAPETTLVVIDPIVDSWSEAHAALVIPSPPHPATPKLYQNGEWKLTLSAPQKRAAPETRSDVTILYDTMAEIAQRLLAEPELSSEHPDLARHARSGYLHQRFCPPEQGGGLTRVQGEVSRPELWRRVQQYMSGGSGPLYCRPEHADGRPIEWNELLDRGSLYYGGVGQTRFLLDYDNPDAQPFRDVYRRPTRFKFFVPTAQDLEIPSGTLLNSGRSSLSDERQRIAFAIGSFNSGKATPIVGMPEEAPLFLSTAFAQKHGISTGQRVRLRQPEGEGTVEFPAIVSDRVKGDSLYTSFHKTAAQMAGLQYVNDLTSHEGRCAYTSQTNMKATRVLIERVEASATTEGSRVLSSSVLEQSAGLWRAKERVTSAGRELSRAAFSTWMSQHAPRVLRVKIDTTKVDPKVDLPIWTGRDTPLYVTEIIQDTHNVYTFRLQGDPLCRFVYWPGQFCTLVLNIDGKKVVRSYSISSSPTRPFVLEFTVKRVPGGLVSNWLPDHVKVGDRLELAGPKGRFCLVPGQIPKKLLFLSAGSGITPLMSMSRWLCDLSANVDVKFLNSIQAPQDLVFRSELEMLASRHTRTFQSVVTTTSRVSAPGWSGFSGRINGEMLQRVAPDLPERMVYLCGPEGFMRAARELLDGMGFNLQNLHSESFAPTRSHSDESVQGTESAAGAPAANDNATDSATVVSVEFARAGKRVRASKQLPLLDIAEAHGVELEYGCRVGNCGECKVKLLHGKASGGETSLSEEERSAGYVLSCVATPDGDCVVDG